MTTERVEPMAKRLSRISEDPEVWIDPLKIVMIKAVTNTAKESLTRVWVEGGGGPITVPGTPENLLYKLPAANPEGYKTIYVS